MITSRNLFKILVAVRKPVFVQPKKVRERPAPEFRVYPEHRKFRLDEYKHLLDCVQSGMMLVCQVGNASSKELGQLRADLLNRVGSDVGLKYIKAGIFNVVLREFMTTRPDQAHLKYLLPLFETNSNTVLTFPALDSTKLKHALQCIETVWTAGKPGARYVYDNPRFVLLGGVAGDRCVRADVIRDIAQLPRLEVIQGNILSLALQPAQSIASILQNPNMSLLQTLKMHAENLQSP